MAIFLVFLFASSQSQVFAAPKKSQAASKKSQHKFATRLMGLQLPTPELLRRSFHFDNKRTLAVLASIRKQAAKKVAIVGFNSNVDIDKAMEDGLPILAIYPTAASRGQNILTKGYVLEAAICQYRRKPETGAMYTSYYQRIGTSPHVCFEGDLESYSLMLVDVFVQMNIHADEYKKKTGKGGK